MDSIFAVHSKATMRVLITGASGFVGRALCLRALSEEYQVRGTLLFGRPSIALIPGVEQVTVEPLGTTTSWTHAVRDIDVVVHLAARVHVMQETTSDPLTEFRKVNVNGTIQLAEEASSRGVSRFIYLSSIGVHGSKTDDLSFSEESRPCPYDPYTTSKWEAERALRKVAQNTGLEVVILRPPLVYGPNAPGNFARLFRLIKRGIPLPLGSVKNKRSFISLYNLIDAITLCIEHPIAANQTFLVSDGQDISTPDFIRLIACAMGNKHRLLPFPSFALKAIGKITGKATEIERLTSSLQIDSSKIRHLLGWKPPFSLEESIRKTAQCYFEK